MLCEFRSEEFRVFVSCCARRIGVEWVDALVEGFVIDGDINVFGETSDHPIDFGKRGRKASGTCGLLFVTTECVSHPSRHYRCLGPELLKRFRGQLFSDGFDGAWADLFFAEIPKC